MEDLVSNLIYFNYLQNVIIVHTKSIICQKDQCGYDFFILNTPDSPYMLNFVHD